MYSSEGNPHETEMINGTITKDGSLSVMTLVFDVKNHVYFNTIYK